MGDHRLWDWLDEAACRRFDPEIFFPIGSGEIHLREYRRAQRICAVCPVIDECAALASDLGATDGVWAGRIASDFVSPLTPRYGR